MRLLILSLLTFACNGNEVTKETGTTDTTDTSETDTTDTTDTSETDTQETGDTGDTGDTGEEPETTDITFVIDGSIDSRALMVTSFRITEEDMSAIETVKTTKVTSNTVTVSLPTPDEADLYSITDDVPDLMGLFFMPTLHIDQNGDNTQNDDEIFTSGGPGWLLYLNQAVPMMGLVEGWNAISYTEEIFPLNDVPLIQNLEPNDSIMLSGRTSEPIKPNERFAVVSYAMLEGMPIHTTVYDDTLTDTWIIEITEPPPADHIFDTGEGFSAALEIPLGYLDNDSSLSVTVGDMPTKAICYEGQTLMLLYIPGITVIEQAVFYFSMNLKTGWSAVYGMDEDEPITIDPTGLKDLNLSKNCLGS